MSLKITVATGLTAGTKYPVEKQVVRIGAGSQCDICLPVSDLAAHAATVEFRNDKPVVYNRCRRSIQIGDTELVPGEQANWPLGRELLLADGAVLVLEDDETLASVIPELQSNPLASGDPRLDHVDFKSQSDDARGDGSSWISKTLQVGIIVFAVGVVLGWFTLGSNTSATPPSQVAAAETTDPAVEVSPERKQAREQLTEELRFAKAAIYRQDWERAELALAIIQEKLSNSEDKREFEQNILQRVKAARQSLRVREN